MRRYILILSLLAYPIASLARQPQTLEFERLSDTKGFSHFSVYSILQDRDGFLWFGSLNGLSRYDGYQFKVFKNEESDSTGLSDDWVLALHEDADGILWIGTATGGLNRFDPGSGQFQHFELIDYVVASHAEDIPLLEAPVPYSLLVNKSITSIHEDLDGVLWIGTWGGRMVKFDKNNERFLKYGHPQTDDQLSYQSPITKIFRDRQGILWIGTFGGGLFRHGAVRTPADSLQLQNSFFEHYQHEPAGNSLSNDRVTQIIEAQPGLLLIATFGGGLSVLDTYRNRFANFAHDPGTPFTLSGNNLVSLHQSSAGDVWIGTFGDGLNQLKAEELARLCRDIATGGHDSDQPKAPALRFSNYSYTPANPESLSDNSVLAIYEDRGGTMWFGTHRGGINKSVPRQNRFVHYSKNPLDANSLSDNAVMAFAEDQNGNVWIGTYNGGLNKLDRRTGTFSHFIHDPQNRNSLSHNNIRSLHVDSANVLWIGTRNGGLNRLEIETGSFQHFIHDSTNPNTLPNDQIIPIFEDQQGHLWIGVFGTGLCRFEKQTGTFTHFLPKSGEKNTVSGKRIYAITQDREGILWIGTFGDGLNAFDPETGIFSHYRHDSSDPQSLSSDRILSIYEDSQGTLWLGTFGGGLCKRNRETGVFERITQKDGLPSDAVLGIVEDQLGNLWLSTGNGLARLALSTGIINSYDVFDGLQSNSFNSGAAFRARSGELFFGSVNGFSTFSPQNVDVSQYQPSIVISEFRKFSQPLAGRKSQIVLEPDENFFTIEFASLDFSNPGKNQFSYKMHGLSNQWIACGTQHSVSYANLPPGNYTFSVRGTNSEGVWSEHPASVKIIIRPPIWRTGWFYLVATLATIVIVGMVLAYQVRARVRRTLELEKVRMLENEKVRKQVAEDFHDELGHKLTHISLFTEIVKRNLKGTRPENQAYLDKISETAKHLSSGISNFIWTLDPEQDSLYDVAFYLKDFGDELFSKTGAHFWANEIPESLRHIKIPMHWRRHLTLLFKESMNNILKHAACENVKFEVRANQDTFEIVLEDDGIGYDDTLYTTGKGLRNMRSRAQKIGCELSIATQPQSGTRICLSGSGR